MEDYWELDSESSRTIDNEEISESEADKFQQLVCPTEELLENDEDTQIVLNGDL